MNRTKIQFQGQTHSDEDWGSRRDRINKGPDRKKSGGLLAHKNSWPTTSPPAPGRKTGHGVYKLGEIVRNRCGRTCVEADELLAALATRCNRRGTAESTRSRADLADRWLTIRTGAAGWKEILQVVSNVAYRYGEYVFIFNIYLLSKRLLRQTTTPKINVIISVCANTLAIIANTMLIGLWLLYCTVIYKTNTW